MKLNSDNLPRLMKAVHKPLYDRTKLRQNTVHIGVGGFHRAHQAVYLDDLLALQEQPRWGECGLGILPGDARMRDALKGQDCLYSVVEKSVEGQQVRVVGSMVDYLLGPVEREAAIEKLAAEDTRIVSMTVTESGYFIDEATREFTPDDPGIQHDLLHPDEPVTSLGYIAAALDRRRLRGQPPFTLMSCDNLQGNGDTLRKVTLAFAGVREPELERGIAGNVAFPNSMVDRITPVTVPEDISALSKNYGFDDAWPVTTEQFRQWVIEDHFCQGRPRWEVAGAEIVSDVAPYELMKMRLLNGSHLAMAYPGALAGYTYVHEIMADPVYIAFIGAFMEEVTPVVPVIAGTSVVEYKRKLLERFANPGIRDQVTRICSEGSAKIPKWLLPSVVELMSSGRSVRLLSLVVASWFHYLGRSMDDQGRLLEIVDARKVELQQTAASGGTDPRAMLVETSIFGRELASAATFVTEVERALKMFSTRDAKNCIREYLNLSGTRA